MIVFMNQVKWFERKFNFTAEQNIFPSVIERLAGTPVRLEEKFKTISPGLLNLRFNDTWSMKENLGHLIDLEPLWQERLEDIVKGEKELRPADLENKKTKSANHNDKSLDELLKSFRQTRTKTVSSLEKLDEQIIFKSALHPRLKTPMRTMDLFLFVAEHDDHHLARVTELSRILNESV